MAPMPYRELSPKQAQQELQRDPSLKLLDVRTPPENQDYRLPNSVLIPLQELPRRFRELDPSGNWLIYCEAGIRSQMACEFLASAGFPKLANLTGGIAHWIDDGLPHER
jgi:adenylyltransferase/sulfurtransferase